jgi:hypothetical protein
MRKKIYSIFNIYCTLDLKLKISPPCNPIHQDFYNSVKSILQFFLTFFLISILFNFHFKNLFKIQ